MNREVQVRICERLGVKFPGPTRHSRQFGDVQATSALAPKTDIHREGRHVSKVPTPEMGFIRSSSACASRVNAITMPSARRKFNRVDTSED